MKDKAIFRSYLKTLHKIMSQGDAREESFYSALEALFNAYANASNKRDIYVTTLPKKTEAGYPDFRIWDGKQHVVGYIEAKHPNERNLQLVSESEQLKRYRHTFPNLILTNFFEFRLYRDGDLVESVQIARPLISTRLEKVPPLEKVDEFIGLLEKFFAFLLPKSYSAESLATELAKRTRFLRDEVISQELAQERERGTGDLLGFYEAFQTYLIGGLTHEDFADLYSQTITYGLFAARVRVGDGFNRRTAFDAIPHTIGILRDLFRFISLGDLPKPLECNVDDIAEVLAIADVQGILHRYFHSGGEVEKLTTPPKGKGSDPIVHFYETFLKHYDPKERERRGVYYTPEPVVSYIVRSLHAILKEKFGKADGLASEGVTLLDPAAGTMTFVAKAAQVAVEEFVGKYGEGSRESFIRDQILKNFYAFELMMAPYAVGHLKMAFSLEELGYRLKPEERVKFYLTNTLETEELAEAKLPGLSSLAEESHKAGKVKKDTPILVILGNPPYSGHSANKGPWIRSLIDDYKKVDGKPLGERNPKWLQDDYVKFIRFAEWKITQAGEGVVGMITNHSYLDNPTFRGMRQHLMDTFDEIYALDLHGNSLKKEHCPDGSKDENVFDIRQGVAIAFFIKRSVGARPRRSAPRVSHAERFGLREAKYEWLDANDWISTDWQELHPKSEFYLYVARDEEALDRYKKFVKVTDIFPVNSVGIVTSRDRFVFDFDREALKRRIRTFLDPNLPDEIVRETFGLKDSQAWNLIEARQAIQQDEDWKKKTIQCLYRPFDVRWLFYHPAAIERGREEVMRYMLRDNLALITPRQHKDEFGAYITKHVGTHKTVAAYDINYYYPLHLYPSISKEDLFSDRKEVGERRPNLNSKVVQTLKTAYGQEPAPEEIFNYVYAVLYASSYREKYAEFLRIDFPRIPFTKDVKLFQKLAALGGRLVDLHLLRSSELDPPIARFQGEGDNRVQIGKKGLRYDSEKQWVYINEAQFFEDVPPEVWEYQIGGYQVCRKWLKDRKGRTLSLDEIKTYCRIVTALEKTIEAQAKIDKLYPKVEETLLPIKL
ncbi:N-6 DNA methylase [Candidatus Bipolaricaulota bacterium]|nr:N-6 DNA methylase [Candidatus Bipolaricaulota bacterium]